MVEGKMIAVFLGNIIGFGVYIMGIIETQPGWQKNVLFVLGAAFLVVKVVGAILELYKKKVHYDEEIANSRHRTSQLRKGTSEPDRTQLPDNPIRH